MTDVWELDSSDGELTLHTGVAGPAARMGHRLTIGLTCWHAQVTWTDGAPDAAELVVDVDSLVVLRGEGGVKGLSGPEKAVVRSNALKALNVGRFPEISFTTEAIAAVEDSYRLSGTLRIRGKTRPHEVILHTKRRDGTWRMSTESVVRQSAFGVKPYSLLMGSLRVADDVTVSFSAVRATGE